MIEWVLYYFTTEWNKTLQGLISWMKKQREKKRGRKKVREEGKEEEGKGGKGK